jgi:hypothetical protein
VLSVFDVEWIEPRVADDDVDELADFLVSCCERVVDSEGTPRWRLRDDERVRALRGASRATLQEAVDSVATRPEEPLQAALEQYVSGSLPSVDEQTPAVLSSVLQLGRWFGEGAGLPPAEEVQARLDWTALTGPMERLLSRGFVGRSDLLADLRAFVDAEPPANGVAGEFMIYGVGGSGKSTVLARLILDLAERHELVVYVNYDRGWLIDGGPWTLLDEIMRQIAVQLPASRDGVAELRRLAQRLGQRATGYSEIASRGTQRREEVPGKLMEELAGLVADHRVVLVLDTFEEMQRRESSVVIEMSRFLTALATALPGLRVIIAGRVLPEYGFPERRAPWHLTGLSDADALGLLRELVNGGAGDELLREVVRLLGGNPLSLHLAADVLNRTGDDPTRLLAVAEGNVQGQLYSRLLEHIGDPRVRAIAHPGLVVRRLTAEIIVEVLAEPCGIAPLTEAEGAQVFFALRREATLCEPSPDGDGALVHRQDVRALMLPSIQHDSPSTTRKIHEAAVLYYEGVTSPSIARKVARREELYHRLMLKQERPELDRRWLAKVGSDLAAVIEELPIRSQLYLTTKVRGLRLDPHVRAEADDHEWRHTVRPAVKQRMERGLVSEALALLRERRGADGRSLLPDLEIEALERLGRVAEALELVAVERERASRRGSLDTMRELISQEARILERMRRWSEAWALLDRLAVLDRDRRARTGRADDEIRIRELVVLTSMLRVARHQGRDDDETRELVRETAALAEATPARLLTGAPSLLRDLASEIGRASSLILALAATTLGASPEEASAGPLPPTDAPHPEDDDYTDAWADRFNVDSDASQDYFAPGTSEAPDGQ